MSTLPGFLRGSRALLAAARSATPANSSTPAPKKAPAAAAAAVAASKPLKRRKERKPSVTGITKTNPISPTLQSIVGAAEVSRVGAVKKLGEYIKLHNLQNPSDKREIFCDAKLKKLFDGKDKVGFLEIGKLLTPHFVKDDTIAK